MKRCAFLNSSVSCSNTARIFFLGEVYDCLFHHLEGGHLWKKKAIINRNECDSNMLADLVSIVFPVWEQR